MELAELFPSRYIKADAEIKDEEPRTLTIRGVQIEELGKNDDGAPDTKPVVYFKEIDKPMVLNKTNAGIIAKLYGTNTDAWAGKQVTVYATDVQMGPEMKRGLRIKTRVPTAAAPKAEAPF